MWNKFFKGLDLAMIPSGIVGIISIGFMLIFGICFLMVFHVLLFESIIEGKINIYCLMVVLFFDSTILLFLFGTFGKKAFYLFPIILLVIGILNIKILFGFLGAVAFLYIIIAGLIKLCNKENYTSNNSYSAPKYSKSNHSDLADKF